MVSWRQAWWPGLEGGRDSAGERKKFCMSMIRRADFGGERVTGVVLVWRVRRGRWGGVLGEGGWVRSKPVWEEWSQKLDFEPIRALRWGSAGMVDGMVFVEVLAVVVSCWLRVWLWLEGFFLPEQIWMQYTLYISPISCV